MTHSARSWLLLITAFSIASVGSLSAQAPKTDSPVHRNRASAMDKNAQEHPEIDFLFQDAKGKPTDWEHARPPAPGAEPRGKLVIWLMDYNASLFERLSSYGLHSIQVHYANKWFGKLNQEADKDPQGLGNIRLEAATGEDFSKLVNIPKPDSILERTRHFLLWLHQEYPSEGWDGFLTEDKQAVRWNKVTLAGISHGSTTAARFALHQEVDRVVMLSGPRDNKQSWQSLPSATPKERFFGFTHTLDMGWVNDHYCRSWELLGLNKFGPLVDVDKQAYPFGNSRRLITSANVDGNADRAHSAAAPGNSALKNSKGEFIHEKVWQYLFTHPVDKVGEAVGGDSDCNLSPN